MMFCRSFRHLALCIAVLAGVSHAHAQTSPNLVYGQVPTAAQWNSYFAGKQDYNTRTVIGPATSTVGACATWANTTGSLLASTPCSSGGGGGGGAALDVANTWTALQTFNAGLASGSNFRVVPLATSVAPSSGLTQVLNTYTAAGVGGSGVASVAHTDMTITGAPNGQWWLGLDTLNFAGTGGTGAHVARYAQTIRTAYAATGGSSNNPELWAGVSESDDFTGTDSSKTNSQLAHEFDITGHGVDDADHRQGIVIVVAPAHDNANYYESKIAEAIQVSPGATAKYMLQLAGPYNTAAIDLRSTNESGPYSLNLPTITANVTASTTIPVSNILPFLNDRFSRTFVGHAFTAPIYFGDGTQAVQTGYTITGTGSTPTGTITLASAVTKASGMTVANASAGIWLRSGQTISLDNFGESRLWYDNPNGLIHLQYGWGNPGITLSNSGVFTAQGNAVILGTTTMSKLLTINGTGSMLSIPSGDAAVGGALSVGGQAAVGSLTTPTLSSQGKFFVQPMSTTTMPPGGSAQMVNTGTIGGSGGTGGVALSQNILNVTGSPSSLVFGQLDQLSYHGTGGTGELVAHEGQVIRYVVNAGGQPANPATVAFTAENLDFTGVASSQTNNQDGGTYTITGHDVDDGGRRNAITATAEPASDTTKFFEARAGLTSQATSGAYVKYHMLATGSYNTAAFDSRGAASAGRYIATANLPTVTAGITSSTTIPVSNIMPFVNDRFGRSFKSIGGLTAPIYLGNGSQVNETDYTITGAGPTPTGTITVDVPVTLTSGQTVANASNGLWMASGQSISLDNFGTSQVWFGPADSMIHMTNGGSASMTISGSLVTITGLAAPLTTPASSSASCAAGQIVADAGFVYVCTASNTWKRATLSTF